MREACHPPGGSRSSTDGTEPGWLGLCGGCPGWEGQRDTARPLPTALWPQELPWLLHSPHIIQAGKQSHLQGGRQAILPSLVPVHFPSQCDTLARGRPSMEHVRGRRGLACVHVCCRGSPGRLLLHLSLLCVRLCTLTPRCPPSSLSSHLPLCLPWSLILSLPDSPSWALPGSLGCVSGAGLRWGRGPDPSPRESCEPSAPGS